jgi:cytochrome c553
MKNKTYLWLAIAVLAVGAIAFGAAAALEDAEHHDRSKNKHAGKEHGAGNSASKHGKPSVDSESRYVKTCGECHFPYNAFLLPQASWTKIIVNTGDHFGSQLVIPPETLTMISSYLNAGAADNSRLKLASKIMRDLGNTQTMRVTEVPYILHKHRKIAKETFALKSVGGLGNCAACHPDAGAGNYDDDSVRIPAR